MTTQRRERLRDLLRDSGFDALFVSSLINIRYLTGFTGSYAQLIVTASGRDVLMTDGRYREQAEQETRALELQVVPPATWVADVIGSGRLGLEAHAITWLDAGRLRTRVAGDVAAAPTFVEQLRQVKDAEEIATLRQACRIADAAFAWLLLRIEPGMTERQIAVLLERAVVDHGAEDRAFDTIVATGPNTAVPHHRPTQRPLGAGELIKIDFGARVGGYHSDMTRMIAMGQPAGELLDVFDVVRAAQAAGVVAARDGSGTGEVDAACREIIAAAGHATRFVHGTGHGIGLEIHEDPYLRPPRAESGLTVTPSVTLRPGMTVTVEPGIYLPGVGGVRIEDSLVVTAAGPDVLTTTPKDLVVL